MKKDLLGLYNRHATLITVMALIIVFVIVYSGINPLFTKSDAELEERYRAAFDWYWGIKDTDVIPRDAEFYIVDGGYKLYNAETHAKLTAFPSTEGNEYYAKWDDGHLTTELLQTAMAIIVTVLFYLLVLAIIWVIKKIIARIDKIVEDIHHYKNTQESGISFEMKYDPILDTHQTAYRHGFRKGYHDGYPYGRKKGFQKGLTDAYEYGHQEGYDAGFDNGSNVIAQEIQFFLVSEEKHEKEKEK